MLSLELVKKGGERREGRERDGADGSRAWLLYPVVG
jgi:hypothetical protein